MEDAARPFRMQKPYARILAACWNPVEAREGVLARLILPFLWIQSRLCTPRATREFPTFASVAEVCSV
jgi:hypothetical protein